MMMNCEISESSVFMCRLRLFKVAYFHVPCLLTRHLVACIL